MGNRYLTGLADWISEAGLVVVEVDGWQTRARSSGGYDTGRPICIMWHHTASKSSPSGDVDWIVHGSPDAPIANLYLARDATVWVCAGGATNTNGKGGPFAVSRGTISADTMNTAAVSIEAANDGVGEIWKAPMVDAYFALSLALTEHLDLLPTDICHHSVWAPSRKVDPARANAVDGDWFPRSTNASGSWSLPDTVDELAARAGQPPPEPEPGPTPSPGPPPALEETDMLTAATDANGTIWIGNGIARRPLDSMDVFNRYVLVHHGRLVNVSGQPIQSSADLGQVDAVTLEALGLPV